MSGPVKSLRFAFKDEEAAADTSSGSNGHADGAANIGVSDSAGIGVVDLSHLRSFFESARSSFRAGSEHYDVKAYWGEEVVEQEDGSLAFGVSVSESSSPGVSPASGSSSPLRQTLSSSVYFDYIPPPIKANPPPPLWKYNTTVIVHVYVVGALIWQAGIQGALTRSGLMNKPFASFWAFFLEVFVIVFFTLDIVNFLVRIKIRGRWFGIQAWYNRPRHTGLEKYNNPLAQFLYILIQIAEDGFPMLKAPPRLETKIVERQQQLANSIRQGPAASMSGKYTKDEDDDDDDDADGGDEEPDEVVLHVRHRIKPNKMKTYQRWRKRAVSFLELQPGFVRYEAGKCVGDKHDVQLVFKSKTALENYMTNPYRSQLYKELEPCLVEPDKLKLDITDYQDAVTGTFGDIPLRRGRGPKKWKIFWLITCDLNFAWMIWLRLAPFYYEAWGLDRQSYWLRILVRYACLVTFLTFVFTPLLKFFFAEWLRRKEGEFDTQQPWKGLNDGFPLWFQTVCATAFFVGTGISWALKGAPVDPCPVEGSNGGKNLCV